MHNTPESHRAYVWKEFSSFFSCFVLAHFGGFLFYSLPTALTKMFSNIHGSSLSLSLKVMLLKLNTSELHLYSKYNSLMFRDNNAEEEMKYFLLFVVNLIPLNIFPIRVTDHLGLTHLSGHSQFWICPFTLKRNREKEHKFSKCSLLSLIPGIMFLSPSVCSLGLMSPEYNKTSVQAPRALLSMWVAQLYQM